MQLKVGRGGADGLADPLQRLQGQPRGLLPRLLRPDPGLLRQGLPQHNALQTMDLLGKASKP